MRINIGDIVTDETLAETEARLVEEAIVVVAEKDAPDVARQHNGRSHLSQVEAMFLAYEVEQLREREAELLSVIEEIRIPPNVNASGRDPAILRYAHDIIEAPDEWTPHYTRSELLPMARAYVSGDDFRRARGRAR